jgi:hypothetical protein
MRVSRIDGFKISMSGSARQIVLFGHGGWSAVIFVPAGTTLHFYTAHGIYKLLEDGGGETVSAILPVG